MFHFYPERLRERRNKLARALKVKPTYFLRKR